MLRRRSCSSSGSPNDPTGGENKEIAAYEDSHYAGDLSLYVPFIDVMLGRGYVEFAECRATYPQYIGPATWTLLHTM